jgi:methionine sulfoxide reductase heme-binding subunit
MNDTQFNKLLILVNGLVPLALLLADWYYGRLGANPIEFFLRTTGILTLVFLFITLAISPLRQLFGWNQLIKFRRMLGLYAFFYGVVHLVTYGIFDKSLVLPAIAEDIWQRPFIAVGMLALLLMVPLAVTSTNGMIRRLGGKNWARLHRLTYAVAALGLIHFFWIQKSDYTYPILFGFVLAFLFGYRIYQRIQKKLTKAAARAEV